MGIVLTTDGTIGEIPRSSFIPVEDKVINQLKSIEKPFIVVLNSKTPNAQSTIDIATQIEEKHGVSVVCVDVLNMSAEDINAIMEKVLLEFPMYRFNVKIPEWMQALPADNVIINEMIEKIKESSSNIKKMKDYYLLDDTFKQSENFDGIDLDELKLDSGVGEYKVNAKQGLFYKVLSDECQENITDDFALMSYIKSFSDNKRKFQKVQDALLSAEENGYGVVLPTLEEMNLEEPVLVKQGGRYGVKLKASAPSLHIMKVDVATEVAPIVGTEKQGEDLINYIMNKFEDNPAGIWETNMFGKSLHDLVNEGLVGKLTAMPKEAQGKMRKTLTRIVNENKGGIICILL